MSKGYPLQFRSGRPTTAVRSGRPSCAFLWSAPDGPERHVAPLQIADRRFGNNAN